MGYNLRGGAVITGGAVGGATNLTTAGAVPIVSASGVLTQDQTAGGQLFWDLANHRLGIGNAAPSEKLHVTGNVRLTGALTVGGLTSGRIPFAGTGGLLGDSSGLSFASSTLTVNGATFAANVWTASGGATLNIASGSGQSIRFNAPSGGSFYIATGVPLVIGDAGDTGLSRISAGLVGFGTSAQGSTAGSWQATNGTLSGTLTYGGVTLSNAVTGTGNMVLSAGPTFTGTAAFAAITASGQIATSAGTKTLPALWSTDADSGIYFSGNNTRFSVDNTDVLAITGGFPRMRMGADGGLGFTATDSGGTIDVSISRNASNVLQIGTSTQNALGSLMFVNETLTGDTTYSTIAKGPILKQGANGRVGTFVLNGSTPVTVSNTSVAITDAIIISLNTVGGVVGVMPTIATITAGTGFTVAGTAADTSTYNYAIIKNAA